MDKGLFISFEGIDGCGKTTMLRQTAQWLEQSGRRVLCTREPGGSELGRELRRVLLEDNGLKLDQRTETLFFAADRAWHCHQVIGPALERGEIVLCDRYADSTLAYQGGGRGLDMDELRSVNALAMAGLLPDLTLLLDIDIDTALKRRKGGPDRMESESRLFFERVAATYRELAIKEPQRFYMIDAAQPPELVLEQIKRRIALMLPEGEPL